jgi:hypothetical protein
MSDPVITCRACGKRHGSRYMCDPLQQVVSAMLDEAAKNDIPVTEFLKRQPLPDRAGMLGDGTVLLKQLKVAGAVVPFEVDGKPLATSPALVFTGLDADGNELPQWVYAGSAYELRTARDLVDRMTEMAIRRAAE